MTETHFSCSLCSIAWLIRSGGELKNKTMLMFSLSLFQISGETVGEVRAVADMHQRKAEMARHSDAFIALPGESHQLSTHM